MLITDIQPGSNITIIARSRDNQMEFKTVTGEVIADKNMILAQIITQDDKLLTFKGHNIIINVLVPLENANPEIFTNVQINLVKKKDGSIWYTIHTITRSKVLNRRASFRCVVGTPTTISFQLMAAKETYKGVIKDVSNTGFGLVCDESVPIEPNKVVYAELNDYIEKLDEHFNFRLSGIVVNVIPMEKNRVKVGCRFNKDIPGIDKYIVTKERMRLRNTHGKS